MVWTSLRADTAIAARIRDRLADEGFDRAFSEGGRLDQREAVAVARGDRRSGSRLASASEERRYQGDADW